VLIKIMLCGKPHCQSVLSRNSFHKIPPNFYISRGVGVSLYTNIALQSAVTRCSGVLLGYLAHKKTTTTLGLP